MQILALIGSPRKGGNTEVLVDELISAATIAGHGVGSIRLYDYDIRACLDCRACQRDDHSCAQADDMETLRLELLQADVLVFATPIYWYGPTAQMKLLIDRFRPFARSRQLHGKRAVLVAVSADAPDCCGPTVQMLRMSLDYLGVSFVGSVLATAYEKGEVRHKPDELAKARALGAAL